jgi:hypothetical protein
MENAVVIALCMVIALWIMVPKKIWRWLAGYTVFVDIMSSIWLVNTGVATGTVTGMTAGFIAALLVTLAIRAMRYVNGAERFALDGDTSIPKIAAGVATQGVRWTRSIFKGLFTGSAIEAPEPLNWTLVETSVPHSWKDVIRDFAEALRPQPA